MNQKYEDLLKKEKAEEEADRIRLEEEAVTRKGPHLVNLNADQLIDRKIVYNLEKKDATLVGRKSSKPASDIVLGGIGIQKDHATFSKRKDGYYLVPKSVEALDNIFVNGRKIESLKGVLLKPNDRVIFGTNSYFIFKDPPNSKEESLEDLKDAPLTIEMAEIEFKKEQEQE